jgi:hypothetical protein
MVGAGALLECFCRPRVVVGGLAITRSAATGRKHPKLREVIHADFFTYDGLAGDFATSDACFFCLGVSSIGMKEDAYTRLTYALTMAAARAMAAANPLMTFCYVSGVGTDSSERGRTMWARVKGRPRTRYWRCRSRRHSCSVLVIQPIGDVQSKTGWVQTAYDILAPFYPVVHRSWPDGTTTTANLGRKP